MAEDDLAFEVRRLRLRPGDVMVFRSLDPLPAAALCRLNELVQDLLREFPGTKAVLLDSGMELGVLRPGEDAPEMMGEERPAEPDLAERCAAATRSMLPG